MTSRVIKSDYYLGEKAAKKLEEQGITIKDMEESARLPERAAEFSFKGTQLQSDNDGKDE